MFMIQTRLQKALFIPSSPRFPLAKNKPESGANAEGYLATFLRVKKTICKIMTTAVG